MDRIDERTKKLKAGKEKLAAFLKKKSKAKKTDKEDKDTTGPQNEEEQGFPEVSSPSAFSNTDSDQFSYTSGDEWSIEESEPKSRMLFGPELADAEQNVMNAERSRHTLDSYILQSSSSEQNIISDIESALSKRDELISKLTESLQASFWQNIPNDEVMTQVQALVEHVGTLQTQLLQADQSLQEQLELHEASALALQAAKEQMLQLQFILNCKDAELDRIIKTVHNNTQSIHSYGMKEMNTDNCQESCLMCEQYSDKVRILEQELYNKIRECERWSCSQQEWLAREQKLLSSVTAKSQEGILFQESHQLGEHGIYTCESQQTSVHEQEASNGNEEQLHILEFQLAKLKHEHRTGAGDISQPSSCGSAHNEYATEHSQCLSQIEHLTSLNLDLQEKLSSLSSVEKDLDVLRCEYEKLSASYQEEIQTKLHHSEPYAQPNAMYSSEKDILIAKIVELQDEVARLQTVLHGSAADDNSSEVTLVAQLQRELMQKDDELRVSLTQLTEVQVVSNKLRCSCESLEKTVVSYEEVIAGLTQQLQAAECGQKDAELEVMTQKLKIEQVLKDVQSRLKDKDLECKQYTENIIKLQDELLSNQHVHSMEISEKEQQLESITDHMTVLDSERAKLMEKVKHLEHRLKMECQQYVDNLQHVMAEKEVECKQYTEKIVRLQDELMSFRHAHDIEISEKNYYFERAEEQMEVLSTEKANLEQRVKVLEHKLATSYHPTIDVSDVKHEMEILSSNVKDVKNEMLTTQSGNELQMLEKVSHADKFEGEEVLTTETTALSQKVNILERELHAQCKQMKETEEAKAEIESQLQVVLADREILQNNVNSLTTEMFFLKKNMQESHSEHNRSVNQDLISVHSGSVDNLDSATEMVQVQGLHSHVYEVHGISDSENKELHMPNLTLHDMMGMFEYERKLAIQCLNETEQLKAKISVIDMNEERHIKVALQAIVDDLLKTQVEFSRHIESLLKQMVGFETQGLEKSSCQAGQLEQKQAIQSEPDQEICQEALQAQLKSTISQWQRLQVIVQEKEIELHRLQENFDEQQRIHLSMMRFHEQQRHLLLAEIESLKTAMEQKNKADIQIDNQQYDFQSNVDSVSTDLNEIINKVSDNETALNNDGYLAQKEIELLDLKTLLASKESENYELVSSLTLFQEEIVNLKNRICDLQQHHGKTIQENMKQKENEVGILEDSMYGNIEEKEIDLINWKIISESQIRDLKSVITERESEIDRLKLVNADIFSENTSLKNQLEARDVTLCDLKSCLANTASEVNALNNAVADSNAETEHLKHQFASKESEVDVLRNTIAAKESDVNVVKEALALKQTEINALQHRLENFKSDNTALKSILAEKEFKMDASTLGLTDSKSDTDLNLKGSDSEKNASTDALGTVKVYWESEQDTSKEILDEAKVEMNVLALTEREPEISNLQQQLLHTETLVGELTQVCALKDAEIEILVASLADRNCEIHSLKSCLSVEEVKIVNFNKGFPEKNASELDFAEANNSLAQTAQIISLQSTLRDNEAQVLELKVKISEKESEILSLKKDLTNRDSEMLKVKESLELKKHETSDFKKKVTGTLSEVDYLQENLTDKDDVLYSATQGKYDASTKLATSELQLEDDDKAREIIAQESETYMLKERLFELENQNIILQTLIREADKELVAMRNYISKKESESMVLKDKLSEIVSQKDMLQDAVTQTDEELADMKQIIKEKEVEVSSLGRINDAVCYRDVLQTTASEVDLEMNNLKQSLAEKEFEISTLKVDLKETKNQIQTLQAAFQQGYAVLEKDSQIQVLTEKLIESQIKTDAFKTSLVETEDRLMKLRNIIGEKDSEIHILTGKVSDAISQVDLLQSDLIKKDEELAALRQAVLEKESEICIMVERFDGSSSHLDALNNIVSKTNKELADMVKSVKEKESEICSLKEALCVASKNESQVLILLEELSKATNKVDSLNEIVHSKSEELATAQSTLENRSMEIRNLNEQLQEVSSQMDVLNTDLRNVNEELIVVKSTSENKDIEISTLKRQLQEASSQVDTLNTELKKTNEEMAIAKSSLENKDKEISSLNEQLQEANSNVSVLHSSLRHADEEITSVKTSLENKDLEVNTLSEKLQEASSHVDSLNANLLKTNRELAAIQNTIDNKDMEINTLNEKLQEDLKNAHDELATLQSCLEKKDLEMLDLTDKLQGANSCVDILHNDLENTVEELVAVKSTIVNKTLEINVSNKQLQESISNVQMLRSDLRNANEELAAAKSSLENTDLEIGNLNKQLQEVSSQVDVLLMDLRIANTELIAVKNTSGNKDLEISSLKRQLQEASINVDALNTELIKANEEVATLKSSFENTAWETNKLNEELQEANHKVDVLCADLRNTNDQLEAVKNTLEYKELEISNFSERVQESDNCVGILQTDLRNANEELMVLKNCVTEKESEICTLKEELSMRESQVRNLSEELSEASSKVEEFLLTQKSMNGDLETVNHSLLMNESEMAALKEKLGETSIQISSLTIALSAATDELAEMKGRVDQKESEISALTERHTEAVSQLNILNSNLITVYEDLKAARDSEIAAESRCTLLEQKLCNSLSQNEAMQTTLQEHEESLAAVTKEKNEFHMQVLTLQEQLEALGVKVHELKAEHSGLKLTLDDSQESKDHMECSIMQNERELSELTSQVTSLEQQVQKLSHDAEVRDTAEQLQETEFKAKEDEFEHTRLKLLQEIENLKQSLEEKESALAELTAVATTTKSECLLQELNTERKNLTLEATLSAMSQEAQEISATIVLQELKLREQAEEISQLTDKLNRASEQLQESNEMNISLQQQNEALNSESHAHLTDIIHQREALEQQVVEMEGLLSQKQREISEIMQSAADNKMTLEQLSVQHLALNRNYKTLLSTTSHLQAEITVKESTLIEQKQHIDEQSVRLNDLSETLTQVTLSINEVNELNIALKAEIDALQENKCDLEHRMSKLQSEFDSQELTATQFMVESKQLSEKLTQMTYDLDTKDATIFDLQHDCDMYIKEINHLKQELEQKDLISISLKQEVESSCSLMERSREEKEMLKANFDSCMEEVQQKLSDQEIELKRLRAQLAEETKNVCQDQNQMKEIYEQQIGQMEEKLLQCEKHCERLEKELTEVKVKSASAKDVYEHQLSEQELHLQSTNSELLKLKDHLSKITSNHKCEIAGLKRLHEIQTNELEESCLTLERTVAEQKRLVNENTARFNRERCDLEQNYEIQLSDVEEKRRVCEMEISRLKKHLDEMKFDHEKDIQSLEKNCEARLYELEDKYCNATNELERLRKTLFTAGGYSEERQALEMRVEELETLRRDLQNRNSLLEDDIAMMRTQAQCREEEMKAVLKNAAEEQQRKTAELNSEILQLQQHLSECDHKHAETVAEIRRQCESQVTDIQSRNRQLEEQICSLEILIEEDSAQRTTDNKHETHKKRNMSAHTQEGTSLNMNVSSLNSPERASTFSAVDPQFSPIDLETFPSDDHSLVDCLPPSNENVPIVEGFVAEPTVKFVTPRRVSQPNAVSGYSVSVEKADFVEEQCDGFQLEIPEHSDQCSDHPIHENVMRERFEPETPDHFLLETLEEPTNTIWQHEMSVDLPPSHIQSQQASFDFSTPEKPQRNEEFMMQDTLFSNFNTNCNNRDLQSTYQLEKPDVSFEKYLNDIKDELEEEYVTKMRQQEIKLTLDYEANQAEYKLEMEQHFAQRMKAVRYEWERKFNKALQKVKKELEKQHKKEMRQLKSDQYQGQLPQHDPCVSPVADESSLHEEDDLVSHDTEETETVNQVGDHLLRENQEITVPSDVLTREIESIQTMETTAEKQPEIISKESSSSSSSATSTPTLTACSPVVDRETGRDEAESSRSEVSDTSSARERFLEELEAMSQQSSQDLPLEWELTSTVIETGSFEPETGNFEREPEHQSVWEVFDGRCVRQDCQELDTLRIQYEHQISSLQRQLEAERRNTQEQMEHRKEEYAQLVSDLRAQLDQEQREELDHLISELTKVQWAEIENINATYQYELSLELTALKLSMEQIYTSKLQLEMSDMKLRYDQRLDALNKQHKEEINILTARSNNIESAVNVSSSLTDRYNSLIQHISTQLEKVLPAGQEKIDLPKHCDDEVVNGDEDHLDLPKDSDDGVLNGVEDQVPSVHFAQDVRILLQTQQEEVLSLRSKLLSEYESLLQHRTEVMKDQSSQVSALEEQMLQLEKQYGEELRSKQEENLCRNGELEEESDKQREQLELQLEELRAYYEAKLEHMRSTYEKEVNLIKENYEQQIAGFVCSRLNEPDSEAFDNGNQGLLTASVSSSDHHEDKPRQMTQAIVKDTETKDIPQSAQTELTVCLKKLESELADKDVQCKELMVNLKSEEFRARSLDVDVANLRKEVEDLQQKSSEALSHCSHLQELLMEKDTLIGQLELEKGESEKLFRDLLEKESSSSVSLVNVDHFSGTDGDDSFISAKDGFRDASPHIVKTPGQHIFASSAHEEITVDTGYDLEVSFPHETNTFENAAGNVNNNSNNNYSDSVLASLEEMVENLKKHIEELDQQLREAKDREAKLQNQIEEKEYNYKEMIETIKLELEHERQIEVETMQSEFKVQLEIELKKQAAELLMSQSVQQTQTVQRESELQDAEAPSAKVVPQSGSQQSATSDDFNMQTPVQEEFPKHSVPDSDSEHHETLQDALHNRSEFYLQQATLVAALAPADTAEVTAGSNISEHISEQPTDTVSALSCHDRSVCVSTSTQASPETDMQNEIAEIEKEYEGKIAVLKEQLEQLSEERALLISNYQEEIEKIHQRLNESEDKYEHLLEDVQSGERKEVYQLLKDKYDEELEIAKSIMQKDFDQTLAEEKKMFVEKHRQLMDGFMEDEERREQEAEEKHKEELKTLTRKFEQTIEGYEQEIEKLNLDLKLLRDARGEETDESEACMKADRTLPEIDEITFSFQELDAKPDSPNSSGGQVTSTEDRHHYSDDTSAVYHGSDDETDANAISTMQIRTFAEVVRTPAPLSVSEREKFERKIQQLVAEVERLAHRLREAENRESMLTENSRTHLSSSDSQTGDDLALIAMLRSDIERIGAERESVLRTNGHLLRLLSEDVKTYIGVEDTISRRLSQVVSGTQPPAGHSSDDMDSHELSQDSLDLPGAVGFSAQDSQERRGVAPDGDVSQDSHGCENTSLLSNATDEGLEVSQRLAESIFAGPDLDAEGEDILTDARGRLQSAVGQLLELMEQSTAQLMEAKATQQELLGSLASRAQQLELNKIRCSELNSQLAAEIEAKEYLVLELHKAEGLISGYSTEREAMENHLQSLEDQREGLIVELDTARLRLQELQPSQSTSDGLNHQQQLPRQNTGQEIQGFSILSQSRSHSTFYSYSFIIIPISVFIGAYLLRGWWLRHY